MTRLRMMVIALVFMLAASAAGAARRDVDHERLSRSLAQLEVDTALSPYAATEIAAARASLVVLLEDSRGKKRVHALYIAERRVDIAWAAAQVADFSNRLAVLQREHDRLLLAAARHEAELSRRELERQHLRSQIDAEEIQRAAREADAARILGEQDSAAAREEADQARRVAEAQARESELAKKEAQLAGTNADASRARRDVLQETGGEGGMQMSLDDAAFGPGQVVLRAEARNALGALVEFVNRDPSTAIRIEGHTDASGSTSANLELSQRRAEAVRDALVEEGVSAARITAIGLGAARPIASNESAEERARNRRINVIIDNKQ